MFCPSYWTQGRERSIMRRNTLNVLLGITFLLSTGSAVMATYNFKRCVTGTTCNYSCAPFLYNGSVHWISTGTTYSVNVCQTPFGITQTMCDYGDPANYLTRQKCGTGAMYPSDLDCQSGTNGSAQDFYIGECIS